MKNKNLFNKAKSAINTSNIAPTLKANFNPWIVPFEMASSILLSFWVLSILMLLNIKDILIIVKKEDLSNYKKLLGNGKDFGIKINYAIQDKPRGLPEAFIIGEKF